MVKDAVRRCQNSQKHGPRISPMHCMPALAHQPWEVLQLDSILGLPETTDRNKAIIVAIDCHTGYAMARACVESTSTAATSFFMQEIVLEFGVSHRVHTDHGTHLKGTFDELCNIGVPVILGLPLIILRAMDVLKGLTN